MRTKIIAIVAAVGICSLTFAISFSLKRALQKTPREKVVERLKLAGGEDRVSQEANAVFQRFGTNKLYFFETNDLEVFSAIAKLGRVDCILPQHDTTPAEIKIMLGDRDEPMLLLIDTNNAPPYVAARDELQLSPSIVFVGGGGGE